jgi:hypothetical protein
MKTKKLKEEICDNLVYCKYSKEEIIEKLLDEDVTDINISETNDFLHSILLNGFVGYNNLSLVELKDEYNERHDDQI